MGKTVHLPLHEEVKEGESLTLRRREEKYFVVPNCDERVPVRGQGGVVDVSGEFLLPERLLRGNVEEEQKPLVRPAGPEEPGAVRCPGEGLHQAVELVAGELDGGFTRFPVEHFDTRLAIEVVDVADLA